MREILFRAKRIDNGEIEGTECNERNTKDCCCPLAKKYEFSSEEILDRCGCAIKD